MPPSAFWIRAWFPICILRLSTTPLPTLCAGIARIPSSFWAPASHMYVGYHQEVEKEIDTAYCQAHSIPILRREVGGGAVYLDSGQLFFQCVFHRERAPRRVEDIYQLFLQVPGLGTEDFVKAIVGAREGWPG